MTPATSTSEAAVKPSRLAADIGFQANRRLLHVQRISQDCALGEDAFHGVLFKHILRTRISASTNVVRTRSPVPKSPWRSFCVASPLLCEPTRVESCGRSCV